MGENSYSEVPVSVVGIGASAGGLEAIQELLSALSDNTGMAFVIIQHLSPDYRSMLSEILNKFTMMPVMQAEDGQKIERNTVYLIPPKYNMEVRDECLVLHEYVHTRIINHPIDIFLRSLAREYTSRAVAVILSGTGSDGTSGIRSVKEQGGVIMVQKPATAKFDGMPRSALSTGFADMCLSPAEIAVELTHLGKTIASGTIGMSDEELLNKIYSILKKTTGVNYTYYKKTTITRRIERRMVVNHMDSLYDYVNYLMSNPEEAVLLGKDMLIGVTAFFRDLSSFEALKEKVIIPLVNDHDEGDVIRVWVPGCSTGEEAYSIAILFCEAMEVLNVRRKVKIFATDLDKEAVLTGGKGQYSDSIIEDVSAQRLGKYFIRKNNSYVVSQTLRKMVVFARQNVFQDPPFGKLDLISCRNMMIYFDSVLQKDLFAIFHMALNNNGYLFLGKSEAVTGAGALFMPISVNDKIFLHNANAEAPSDFNPRRHLPAIDGELTVAMPMNDKDQNGQSGREEESFSLNVLEKILPPTLLVDEENLIRHVFGDCNRYLRFTPGKVELKLFTSIIDELKIAVSTALKSAREKKERVVYQNVPVKSSKGPAMIAIEAQPVPARSGEDLFFSVSFLDPVQMQVPEGAVQYEVNAAASQRISDLEDDLAKSQNELKKTVSELETVNEELQATNEELLTANEELQSSNEELQSVNEELYTVNAEYQDKLGEVTSLNNDLSNFMSSTMVGIIFLDEHLQIRRYTDYVSKEFSVMEQDIGRTIRFMAYNFMNVDLVETCRGVLRNMMPVETDVASVSGKNYFMRVAPYRTEEQKILGVVITLVDTTPKKEEKSRIGSIEEELNKARQESIEKSRFLSTMSHDVRTPLNAILGTVQLMEVGKDLPDDKMDSLKSIEDNVSYLLEIFNDILETSQLQGKHITIRRERTDGVSFIQSIVPVVSMAAERKKVTLNCQIENDISDPIMMDTSHVRQILVNLVENSIKYTEPNGKIDFVTTMERLEDGKIRHTYVIADNGCGMSEAYQKRMYRPFERENIRYDQSEQGTGLGLYIVKELVDAMDGSIDCQSTKGIGTTFTVTLDYSPLEKGAGREQEKINRQDRDAFLEGKRVLICEDHPVNAEIATEMLKHAGMISDIAVNGREGVIKFDSSAPGTYDAILMDLRMPVMNGSEACVAIRSRNRPDARTIPIIAMTADLAKDSRESVVKDGMNGFVYKPIHMNDLYDTLYRMMKQAVDIS